MILLTQTLDKIMRRMLLSFKADVYNRIVTGTKIYEHRKVFSNEKIIAYLYVSVPVWTITCILYLGRRYEIKNWLRDYSYDLQAVEHINNYLEEHHLERFIVPQMYYYLDEAELLSYCNYSGPS